MLCYPLSTMLCPYCGYPEDKVVDSRSAKEGRAIRRRRECLGCGKRFTTYEYIESVSMVVVKSDGRREPFERDKISRGVLTACKKRPIGIRQMDALVDRVETLLHSLGQSEVSSQLVGELVMKELQGLDEVAYVRFASVYRRFKDANEFLAELRDLAQTTSAPL